MCENSRGVVKGFAEIYALQENVYLTGYSFIEACSACRAFILLSAWHGFAGCTSGISSIVGMGAIGSMMVQLCRLAGAAQIVS
ncbi:MAG: hypothetical protein ACLRL6_00775 [Clostridium sp.]